MQVCLLVRSAGYSLRKGQEGAHNERQGDRARRMAADQEVSEIQEPGLWAVMVKTKRGPTG